MGEYSAADMSHPLPAAQKLGRRPVDKGIKRIRADRWIVSPRAVDVLNLLKILYVWRDKQRMHKVLLIGPTNNGK